MAIGPHTFATLVFRNLRLPPFFQRPHIGFCSAIVDPTTDGARFQLGFRMARSETSFFTNCRFASTWSDSLVKVAEVTVRVEFYRHLDLGSVSSRAVGRCIRGLSRKSRENWIRTRGFQIFLPSGWWDLNPRPPGPEPGALPS